MRCKFVVGQDVVCTKKERWIDRGSNEVVKYGPLCGEVCKIRMIRVSAVDGDVYLHLENFDRQMGFNSMYFKPVFKNDISLFQEMLRKSPSRVSDPVQ